MENKFKEIKEILITGKHFHKLSLNEDISENKSDEYYDAAWDNYKLAAKLIVEATDKKIDEKTSLVMILNKTDHLIDLFSQMEY